MRRAAALSSLCLLAGLVLPASASAAIGYIGAASAGNGAAGATAVTVAAPAGGAQNDVLVAAIGVRGTGTATPPNVTTPAGWVAAPGANIASGNHVRQVIFYRVAGVGEPASYTFNLSASAPATAVVGAYRGVNTTSPVDLSGAAPGTTGNASGAGAAYTPGTMQVSMVTFGTAETVTSDARTTERAEVTSSGLTSGTGVTTVLADMAMAGTGSTGTLTATPSSPTFPWVGGLVGLRDAGSATLSLDTTNSPSFSATLNGTNLTRTFTAPLDLVDTRSASTGWNVSLTSTQFTSGARTLAAGAASLTSMSQACKPASTCTNPSNSVTYPKTVPAGATPPTPVKIYNAASGSGIGSFTLTPTVSVAVPANTRAGSYTSTLTLAIADGP